jgi:hypothetical protein
MCEPRPVEVIPVQWMRGAKPVRQAWIKAEIAHWQRWATSGLMHRNMGSFFDTSSVRRAGCCPLQFGFAGSPTTTNGAQYFGSAQFAC